MIKSTPLLFFMLKSCLLLSASTLSHADMYYWTTADGSLMATDQPPQAGIEYRTQHDLQNVNEWQQPNREKSATSVAENAINKPAADVATTNAAKTESNETDLITVKLSPNAPPQEMAPVKTQTTPIPATETPANETPGSESTESEKTASTTETGNELSIGAVSETPAKTSKTELTAQTLQPDDEAGCQALYGVNCDKVFNWRKYGEKYCEEFKHERCSDADWFERRFKPITLADRQKMVLRNAARKSRQREEIREYLLQKYTGVCATNPERAPTLCNNLAYDAKILNSFRKLDSQDQADIKRLQEILKTSKDRSLTDRAIEELLSYLPWAAASGL